LTDKAYRGNCVGKALVESIKQWAKERGNDKLSPHCNVKRAEAHVFYEHLDFKEIKQQKNYIIDL